MNGQWSIEPAAMSRSSRLLSGASLSVQRRDDGTVVLRDSEGEPVVVLGNNFVKVWAVTGPPDRIHPEPGRD